MPPVIVRVSNCSSMNTVLSWIDEVNHLDPVIEYLIFRNSSYDLLETYTTSVSSRYVIDISIQSFKTILYYLMAKYSY